MGQINLDEHFFNFGVFFKKGKDHWQIDPSIGKLLVVTGLGEGESYDPTKLEDAEDEDAGTLVVSEMVSCDTSFQHLNEVSSHKYDKVLQTALCIDPSVASVAGLVDLDNSSTVQIVFEPCLSN